MPPPPPFPPLRTNSWLQTSLEMADSRGQLWWRGKSEVWVIQVRQCSATASANGDNLWQHTSSAFPAVSADIYVMILHGNVLRSQLSYQTGASGIFQCDIGVSEDETRLSIIAFEDCAAAETVCRLSQQWTDLTADAVQAKGTAMRPDDLMRLARQTQSDVTVLKGADLRGLSPAMTPDDLADLIMAAVGQ